MISAVGVATRVPGRGPGWGQAVPRLCVTSHSDPPPPHATTPESESTISISCDLFIYVLSYNVVFKLPVAVGSAVVWWPVPCARIRMPDCDSDS